MHRDNHSLAEIVIDTVRRHGTLGGQENTLREQWDRTLGELLRVRALKDDCDGQGARAADAAVIATAIEWAKGVRECGQVPAPAQVVPGVDGEVLLVWQGESYYLEAEFCQTDQVEWMVSVPGQPNHHGSSAVTVVGLVE